MTEYKYRQKVTGYPCGCELVEAPVPPEFLAGAAAQFAALFDEQPINFRFFPCKQHHRIGHLTHEEFANSPLLPEWPPTLADLDRIVVAFSRGDRYLEKITTAYLN